MTTDADAPNLESATTETDATDVSGTTDAGTVLTDTSTETTSDVVADNSGNAEDANTNDGDAGETGESDGGAPDAYADFTMPDGIEIDQTLLESATPMFKELGLNQEQAQKLVDFQAGQVQAAAQAQVDTFNQLKDDWSNQSKSDKEFGGDNFEKNIGVARAALDTYGTPELTSLMNDYGIGNHPEIIRLLVKVGGTLQEDVPGSTTAASKPDQSRVDQLYPTS